MLGVDHKTVGNERKGLVGTGEIPQLEVTEGLDGKKRKKPIRTAFIDDTPEGKKEALSTAKQITPPSATTEPGGIRYQLK